MRTVDVNANRACRILLIIAVTMIVGAGVFGSIGRAKRVLIVMDETEQMGVLADYMKAKGPVVSTIVDQKNLPEDISSYDAVVGYIHGKLDRKTEIAIIDYTKKGGRFVCLHHMISSGKAKNEFYFDFLGIQLDKPGESRNPTAPGGGYAWRHPVDMTIVNVNPEHYISNHNIKWDRKIAYKPSDEPSVEKEYPAFEMKDTEFYLNHKFTDGRVKTVLLGFKCLDDRNGVTYMQDRAGWVKKQGKGRIVYLKMGHSTDDFRNPNVCQLILNAVLWTP